MEGEFYQSYWGGKFFQIIIVLEELMLLNNHTLSLSSR